MTEIDEINKTYDAATSEEEIGADPTTKMEPPVTIEVYDITLGKLVDVPVDELNLPFPIKKTDKLPPAIT